MQKKPKIGLTNKAESLAAAAKSTLPRLLQTYLDGLDALTDGRGFNREHQKAAEYVIEAVRYATIRRDALQKIVNYPFTVETDLNTAVDNMQQLAKAALR